MHCDGVSKELVDNWKVGGFSYCSHQWSL